MQAVNQHLSSTSLDFPSASHFSLQKRSKIPDFLLLHLWLESSSNSTNLNHLLLSQKKKKKKNRSASVAGRGFSLSAFIPQPSVLSQTLLWLVIWISKLDVCRRWMSKQSQTKQYTRLLTLAQPEGKKKKRKPVSAENTLTTFKGNQAQPSDHRRQKGKRNSLNMTMAAGCVQPLNCAVHVQNWDLQPVSHVHDTTS